MSTNTRKDLIESRMLIASLCRVCRQTIVYLQGKSAMDENRMKQALSRIVTDAEKFMNRNS